LWAYASPLVGTQFLYMLVLMMYMNFATDRLFVAPGVIGTVFFAAKIWDAISDPLIGYWSDRTHHRLGRRRPWILYASVPFALFTIMLWSPPQGLSDAALLGWIVVTVFGFYTAYTVYAVPQLALGAEISPEPTQRGVIFGARQVATSIGMLLAFVLGGPLLLANPDARETASTLAWLAGSATALVIAGSVYFLPAERSDYLGRGAQNPFAAVRDVWRNPHARLLLFVYFIEVLGVGGTSAMTAYVLKYVTKAENVIGVVFLAYTVPTILSIPFWIRLGERYERHKVWMFAMGMSCIGYGGIVFQDEGRIVLMVVTSLINGLAGGCGATLGQAIKADIVDYDEHQTGERKEGAYFATWNFAGKLGTGLMMAFAGWALQASGFEPNVEQAESVQWTIVLLMGGAPFLGFVIGIIAFSRFRLTRDVHSRIRAELDARALQ
jgi:GPH family glycoside/pentoside/hexuronide:cation symporter